MEMIAVNLFSLVGILRSCFSVCIASNSHMKMMCCGFGYG